MSTPEEFAELFSFLTIAALDRVRVEINKQYVRGGGPGGAIQGMEAMLGMIMERYGKYLQARHADATFAGGPVEELRSSLDAAADAAIQVLRKKP